MAFVKPVIWDDSVQSDREFNKDTDTLPLCKFLTVSSTPFTVTDEDVLLVDPGAAASDIDINLPTSASRINADNCQPVTIKNIHSANDFIVNIIPNGVEEIDEDAGTLIIRRRVSLTLIPDGSNWWII